MTKNALNQNTKFVQELLNSIENNFVFATSPINRFEQNKSFELNKSQNKTKKLLDLKSKINSIQNCNLRDNSNNILMSISVHYSLIQLLTLTVNGSSHNSLSLNQKL